MWGKKSMRSSLLALWFAAVLCLVPVNLLASDHTVINQQLSVSVTGTSTKLLNANVNRKYLIIINSGTDAIYIKAASAHSGTEGVKIPAGGNWEPFVPPIDSLYFKSASGTQAVSIIEGI